LRLAAGGPALAEVALPGRSVVGEESLSVNDRVGPVAVPAGKFTLQQKFAAEAAYPKKVLPCKAASAEFAPDPALDPLWISYPEPFHGAVTGETTSLRVRDVFSPPRPGEHRVAYAAVSSSVGASACLALFNLLPASTGEYQERTIDVLVCQARSLRRAHDQLRGDVFHDLIVKDNVGSAARVVLREPPCNLRTAGCRVVLRDRRPHDSTTKPSCLQDAHDLVQGEPLPP